MSIYDCETKEQKPWLGGTYTGEQTQDGEVLEGLEAADVEADHLELGERLQVGLVVRRETLQRRLVEDQIVKL